MKELSMHVLDIVENSVAAGASKVEISLEEDKEKNVLIIQITDDGKGMDGAMMRNVLDPFVTTKAGKRVGLGLSLLLEAAKRSGGGMTVDSRPGRGTVVKATFGLDHVDRQPVGDMVETVVMLVVGNTSVRFQYRTKKNKRSACWDTARIEERFENVQNHIPELADFIREELRHVHSFD
ncbi:MAG: ATP-binding protein [bacterium]